mmetsp:Transcript_4340/g.8701  ORF Transcript_4340/g.8701 Transcript_4340/m.8701 type:complete len:241 (-) Transcript_4340:333-1055(-)
MTPWRLALAEMLLGVCVEEVGHPVDRNNDLDGLSKFPPGLEFAETLTMAFTKFTIGSGRTTDPWVLKNLWDGDALRRVHGKHPSDELFSLRGDVLPIFLWEVVASALDLLVKLLCFLVVERRETTEEDVEDNSQAPNVNSFIVFLFLQNFGGNITGRSARGSHHPIALRQLELGKTKIRDLNRGLLRLIRVNEVLWFKVAMNDSNLVKISKGNGNAANEYGSFFFGVTPFRYNPVKEFSA